MERHVRCRRLAGTEGRDVAAAAGVPRGWMGLAARGREDGTAALKGAWGADAEDRAYPESTVERAGACRRRPRTCGWCRSPAGDRASLNASARRSREFSNDFVKRRKRRPTRLKIPGLEKSRAGSFRRHTTGQMMLRQSPWRLVIRIGLASGIVAVGPTVAISKPKVKTVCGTVVTIDCDRDVRKPSLRLRVAHKDAFMFVDLSWVDAISVAERYEGAEICGTGIEEKRKGDKHLHVDDVAQLQVVAPPPMLRRRFGEGAHRICEADIQMPTVTREVRPNYTRAAMEAERSKERCCWKPSCRPTAVWAKRGSSDRFDTKSRAGPRSESVRVRRGSSSPRIWMDRRCP